VAAARRYEGLTGRHVDIEETALAAAYQALAAEEIERLRRVDATLRANDMPGLAAVGEYDEMVRGLRDDASDEVVVRMAQEGASFAELRDKFGRIAEGAGDPGLARLRRLRRAADEVWPTLRAWPAARAADALDATEAEVTTLREYTRDERFYAPDPVMDRLADQLYTAYAARYETAHADRAEAYAAAVAAVQAQDDWAAVAGDPAAAETLLGPLRGRDHAADRPTDALACRACGASPAALAADLAAVERHRADVLARLRELAAPPEARVQRVRLADVLGPSPRLSAPADVDALLARLDDHLRPLIEAGIQVIVE
jgi:hypothetical protein